MNIRDTQYAVANKIPYKQLQQQKQLNKTTIERTRPWRGRARTFLGNEDKPAFIRPAGKITGFATISGKGCRADVAVNYDLNSETVLRDLFGF